MYSKMKNRKTLDELEYDLELNRVVKEIEKQKASKVLIQLPDGFKPYATLVAEELRKQTRDKVEILIWMDSCFGACDIPLEAERIGVDMIIQFGHSAWKFEGKNKKELNVL